MLEVTWRHQNKAGGGESRKQISLSPKPPLLWDPNKHRGAFQTSFGSFKRSRDHIESFISKGLWEKALNSPPYTFLVGGKVRQI